MSLLCFYDFDQINFIYLFKKYIFFKGFGPGYKENRDVEIVKHDKVCPDAIK